MEILKSEVVGLAAYEFVSRAVVEGGRSSADFAMTETARGNENVNFADGDMTMYDDREKIVDSVHSVVVVGHLDYLEH